MVPDTSVNKRGDIVAHDSKCTLNDPILQTFVHQDTQTATRLNIGRQTTSQRVVNLYYSLHVKQPCTCTLTLHLSSQRSLLNRHHYWKSMFLHLLKSRCYLCAQNSPGKLSTRESFAQFDRLASLLKHGATGKVDSAGLRGPHFNMEMIMLYIINYKEYRQSVR